MNSPLHSLLLCAITIVLGLALALAAFYYGRSHGAPAAPMFLSGGPTVQQLESLGHLTALRLTVADVMEGRGHGYRGAWLIRGDALYLIDLRQATVPAKDEIRRNATIELPPPVVAQPRVDHHKTMTYSVEKTGWVPWSGDQSKLRDAAMREAQRLVERAASHDDYLATAQQNAALILKSMYALVGWDITVAWQSPPDPARETR